MKLLPQPEIEILMPLPYCENRFVNRLLGNCPIGGKGGNFEFHIDREINAMDDLIEESHEIWQHVLLTISPNFGYED